VDDDLNRLLVNPLPLGVRLHAIIDACHSGSVLDLEYRAEFQVFAGNPLLLTLYLCVLHPAWPSFMNPL
jgi:hypothetical protein